MSYTKTPSQCFYVTRCKNIFFRYNNQTFMLFFNRNREKQNKKYTFHNKKRAF